MINPIKSNILTSPTWIQKLQLKWKLKNGSQVLIILLVFACTGFTVMFLKPVIHRFFFEEHHARWFSVAYWILVLPFYNLLLLFYGFLLGQFKFFWEFEKRFFARLFGKRKSDHR